MEGGQTLIIAAVVVVGLLGLIYLVTNLVVAFGMVLEGRQENKIKKHNALVKIQEQLKTIEERLEDKK